jgi:hypothetical protein
VTAETLLRIRVIRVNPLIWLSAFAVRAFVSYHSIMPHQFAPGDDLVFQLESGLGLLRILAIEGEGAETVWHLLAYEDFFPSVEAAEEALRQPAPLAIRKAHMALTDRAFERTPAARLGNRPLTETELAAYRQWTESSDHHVHDRSALLLLGIR